MQQTHARSDRVETAWKSLADYADRKRWTLPEAEKWLSSNLRYDPDD